MRTWLDYVLFGILLACAIGFGAIAWQVYQVKQSSHSTFCQAAQATILEETDLITAAGKFPSEKITDRWKKLLKGC